MALQKQSIPINFSQGVSTKIDPFQVPIGQFQALTNTVFSKDGLMTKRNGFQLLTTPNAAQTISTLNGGLVALGQTCQSYSEDSGQLTDAGLFQPMMLSTAPMVRRATSQLTCDVAVAPNGLACSVWLDVNGDSYYQISDSITGQIVIPAVQFVATATMPRAYIIENYFVVTYLATIAGPTHLQYIVIPIGNPGNPTVARDISAQASSLSAAYDGMVVGNQFYVALNCGDIGGAIRVWSATSQNLYSGSIPVPGVVASTSASLLSLTIDSSNPGFPTIWVSYYDSPDIKAFALNGNLTLNLAPTTVVVVSGGVNQITSTAIGNVDTIVYENANTYGYTPAYPEATDTKTDYISMATITLSGTPSAPIIVLRGVGIASRAVISTVLDKTVILATYGQQFQPTYYLIDLQGNVLSRFAYSNGIGYLFNQIQPNINQTSDGILRVGYLYADLLQAVSKTQSSVFTGVYSQYGINLITFDLGGQTAALEIGGSLHASGGMLWQYDGVKIREFGFNVWPEDIGYTWSATDGSMAAIPVSGGANAGAYFYQVTYEWTDAAGMLHRSAPSIPISITTTGSGTAGSVTLNIPTLRQTYKTDNIVRIVIYRWSIGQEIYFQVTSITSPLLNDPTVDYVTYIDTQSDAEIDGNNIIYTAGGVIEDICAPAAVAMTLWQSRLFLADAEDPNLIWFSKQVIESTPVEMSDLLTLYIAPTTGAQGSTGPITALSAMDDKLIIFKRDALYYINGAGPDNTGASNTFSDPIFISSTVGCINPQSIVLTPNGIMFQSDKGIWLLGRDLSTSYLGAAVESYTQDNTITSALCIPATNQVRFTLSNKTGLMYDYYFNRWSNWTNIPAISSVVYGEVQTYLNTYNQIVQETTNEYLDIATPVLLGLTTGWINLAGLQGFERFYFAYLLGTYYTPFKLAVNLAYNYDSSPSQSIMVTPTNYTPAWGDEAVWGSGGPWGGPEAGNFDEPANVFGARLFPQEQKCQSFQVNIQEIYDPSFGVPAGEGLTLSGLNLIIGTKRGWRTQSAGRQYG